MTQDPSRPHRDVVSFVRRGSRLSASRQDAWDRLADTWVLDLPRGERDTVPAHGTRLDPAQVFGRTAPLVVEIGSGQGENIAAAATARDDRDHLAFEVYVPGIAQSLDRIERAGSPRNLRLVPLDALHSLPTLLAPGSITELWIFFPDPWHKSRHHKRRLVNPPLLDAVLPLMAPGGLLRLATDWAEYACHMRAVLDADPRLVNTSPDGPRPDGTPSDEVPDEMPVHGWSPRFEGRVLTSFERKAHDAGRLIWDLTYEVDGEGSAGASARSSGPTD
ncbi:tRNA (guanosine(46)-N7)-methyltransferase TrmB [Brachybacterium endophyticum]|uniref:tRNA (guanine-N(7)-)-methyltransferase n=1 Tax=Brachybacterium endophyticum TaxID=2182385 RepID=A0A2U2RLF9_9MICO|nr:tRNA (guanosine(46)-N7)-methyltransferase TrmB [Brachybacterium endophyticum]PWH06671.1 tRNA (guanosine(46)-N7)-methyltransferase TrmB [Brachybacterium endophyticum]